MDIQRLLHSLGLRDRRDVLLALSLPIVGAVATRFATSFWSKRLTGRQIYAAPRPSLQRLSQQGRDEVPYPSDALPGGRDVETPYGNVRVYEWGPEEGRRVLLVHGISTPCVALARLARLLADRGCRVMLFDLFGRGYSDAPDPAVYRQDSALWTSQIMLVIASSRVAWIRGFALIGYSMGGGIAANFTSYFPDLVESLVLIAPAGLIRPHRISRSSRWLYGGLLPQFLVDRLVRGRLKGGSAEKPRPRPSAVTPGGAVESEVPAEGHPANMQDSRSQLFDERPGVSIATTVSWQLDAHPGFLPAFVSSIQHAPITDEHERWRLIGRRCVERRASADSDKGPGLTNNKVLILLGADDAVIIADETENDAQQTLGRENVTVVRLKGGHDVPIVSAVACADAIFEMWDGA